MLKKILLLFLLSCVFLFVPVLLCSEELVNIKIIKKDTLIGLSKKLLEDPSRWTEIAKANNLKKPYRIFPGDELVIPARLLKPEPYPSTVTFVSGEAMFRIKGQSVWKKLSVYEKLTDGAMIRTAGPGSAVDLTYLDGSVVQIRPDTSVSIAASGKRGETITERRFVVETGRVISRIKKALGAESRFQIDTPSAVAGVKGTEFRTSVDADKTTRTEVIDGVVDLKSIKNTTVINKGEGALARAGEPTTTAVRLLAAPLPTHPSPIYKSIPFDLMFNKVEGAVSNRIVIARDSEFRYPLSDSFIKSGEPVSVAGLKDGLYYVRTSSIDSHGLEGVESAAFELKIRVNPLPPFTQSPAEKAEVRSRDRLVDFVWLKVADAAAYHIQIAEDKTFAKVIQENDGIKTAEYRSAPLDYKTYYFRICSKASDGYEAAWSDALSFTVVPPPPAPPLEKPSVSDKEIQIRWQKVQRATQYHFQMSRDNSFKTLLVDSRVESPSVNIVKPQDPGMYYVRTSSVDQKGFEGDFSGPQIFEVKPPAAEEKKFPYEILTIMGGIGLILLLAL